MGTTLPDGAPIRIALPTDGSYRNGEVIAFLVGAKVVVHRVVGKRRRPAVQSFLITRGDSRKLPDPPITANQVLGPVVEVQVAGTWQAPGPATPRSLPIRAIQAVALLTVKTTLEISPPAATRALLLIRSCSEAVHVRLPGGSGRGADDPAPRKRVTSR